MAPGSITQPNWTPTVVDENDPQKAKKISVPAQPAGLWTKIADFVPAGRRLKIQVAGNLKWCYDPAKPPCTADGAPGDTTLAFVPTSLLGCLVGKVGGSASDSIVPPPLPAGTNASATNAAVNVPPLFVFSVGSFCIVTVAQNVSGALFLAMNDSQANFAKHAGTLEVEVFDAA